MKTFLALVLVNFCFSVFGQSGFNSLIKNAQLRNLPYTTHNNLNKTYRESQSILHSKDSTFIIEQIKSILPTTINPFGGTAFGQLDCEDNSNCLNFDDYSSMAILFVTKLQKHYFMHLELTEKETFGQSLGILMGFSHNGEIKSWIRSNGSANSGNPNGNITRNFTILADEIVEINEVSWGDNTEAYTFKATYNITNGVFELIDLCIHY